MDLNLLSQLLKELILDNDRVSLPGMGSFIADIAPAYFSEDGKTINPPFRRIFFRSTEMWNDELIEKYYADKLGVDRSVVKNEVEEFFEKLRLDLNVKKSVELPGFGKMRSTKEGNLYFVAERGLDIYANAYGLEPISLKVLSQFEGPQKKKRVAKEMDADNLLSDEELTDLIVDMGPEENASEEHEYFEEYRKKESLDREMKMVEERKKEHEESKREQSQDVVIETPSENTASPQDESASETLPEETNDSRDSQEIPISIDEISIDDGAVIVGGMESGEDAVQAPGNQETDNPGIEVEVKGNLELDMTDLEVKEESEPEIILPVNPNMDSPAPSELSDDSPNRQDTGKSSSPDPKQKTAPVSSDKSGKGKKGGKGWLIFAIIMAVLVLIVLLLIVFEETGILDRLMYSKSELELMRGVGR